MVAGSRGSEYFSFKEKNSYIKKMELLNKLNAHSSLEGSYKKMNELIIGEKYPVMDIEQKTTKYGDKLVLLEDGSSLYLPKRCDEKASDYLKLNEIKPIFFVYLGTKDVGESQPAQMFVFEQ